MSRNLEQKIDALTEELAEIKEMVMSIKSDSDYWIQKAADEERELKRTGKRPTGVAAVAFKSTGETKVY